jgi:hypothetical protein
MALAEQYTWLTTFEEIEQELGFFKGDLCNNDASCRICPDSQPGLKRVKRASTPK